MARVIKRINFGWSLTRKFSSGNFASGRTVKQQILAEALNNVPVWGWSEESIAYAVQKLGLPALSHRIVERGSAELVEYFLNHKRQEVAFVVDSQFNIAAEKDSEFESSSASDTDEQEHEKSSVTSDSRLIVAISAHMDMIAPYRNSWPSAIACLLAAPTTQMPYTLKTLWILADDLSEYAGIEASRLDWYTERLLLLGLYCTTELYMLTDSSENLRETK